ncbi:MAG: hypothetical protein HQK63_11195 [Desulfamplus sp.]|nr:hypothetical protein [Desulfamplus sp.]
MGSSFIKGLINEKNDSLTTQLSLWHHLTLRNILQRKFTGWITKSDHLEDFLQKQSQVAGKLDTITLRTWKLNEIMQFFKIPIPEELDLSSLNTIGIEIEVQSTALLRKIDKEFSGSSHDDMVRHLLIKIIDNFSKELKKKNSNSQEEIIQKVLEILQSMPIDQQEVLKGLLSIEEFSPDVIRNAIFDHSLATALNSFMMMVKYTVYYEVAKIAVVLSGAVTLYLAKSYVRALIPFVLFIFSPIAMATIGVGLTWWTDYYTNRQIKSFLLPIMVMSSILEFIQNQEIPYNEDNDKNVNEFIIFYNQRYNNKSSETNI